MFSIFKWDDRAKPVKPPTTVKPQPTRVPSDIFEECRAVLPEGYAQNVLDMEMRLEFDDTFTLETVQGLNELYRIGVEYYINVDPKKASHFQRKLANLLTHPRTLSLIENKDKQRARSVNPRPITTEVNNRLKQEVSKFNSQANTVVKSFITVNEQKLANSEQIVRDSLKKQEAELRTRIIERSKSKRKN